MAHQLRHTVNCSLLFTELPLLERPAAARQAGFGAVEFWWPFVEAVPPDRQVDAFVAAITDAGVQLTGLNFFAGDMPGGDRGLVSWPKRAGEFRDNVDVVVGIGSRLGTLGFNALYGNRLDEVAAEEQDELAVENLALAARAAARLGATVLLEPVSGAPRYPLLTAADALAVIDRVDLQGSTAARRAEDPAADLPALGLLADLYHLAVNGDDVERVIADHTHRIAHVQIADAPGRGEPGSGTLPLDQQLTALEANGYTGLVGLEYKPSTTTDECFGWLPFERRR
ncbi:TIM barrel protein [Kribbella sp. NPDC005582]|uniref:hydroxypyruvate isomerase family protein n=1 Tax=Kribbella sp. NPDC005582 TaxID=3156893 RepID=UPI0033AA8430